MKTKKSRILLSAVSVLLVFSLLVGGTMAWFTDTEKVDANFTAGILDINVKPDIENQATLEFKNLRPMQYDNFYAELNAAGGANNVAANGMDVNDFKPAPVYFQPVKITNDGTLPVKYEISVEDIGAQKDMVKNVLPNDEGGVYQPEDKLEIPCEEAPYILKDVLKIFVYKNVNHVWTLMEGVNLNSVTAKADKEEDVYKADGIMSAKGEETYVIAGYLPEGVTNEYQGKHFHGNVVVNAYQPDSTEGASSGGSSEPEAKDIPITIHYTLADNTTVGNDYQITAKSDAFPYTVTEAMAAPGLPQGYHFADPEQSYKSTLTGDTASDVTFIVEKDEEPVEPAEITFILYDVFNEENVADVPAVKITETTTFDKNNTELYLPEGYVLYPDTQTATVTITDGVANTTAVTFNVYKHQTIDAAEYIVVNSAKGVNNIRKGLNGTGSLGSDGDGLDGKYVFEKSVTMTGSFTPLGWVGNTNQSFTGVINGAGYSINGMNIAGGNTSTQVGLVAINEGTIKNLSFSDATVGGSNYVGTVVGTNKGTVADCHVVGGSVEGSTTSSNYKNGVQIGGLVGRNNSGATVESSSSSAYVKGLKYVGGLVGANFGLVDQSYATGNINTAIADSTLMGNAANYFINYNYFMYSQIGGLVGENSTSGIIKNSYAVNSMKAFDYVGGISGTNYGQIIDSFGAPVTIYYPKNYSYGGYTFSAEDVHPSVGTNHAPNGTSGTLSRTYCVSMDNLPSNGEGNRGAIVKSRAQLETASTYSDWDTSIWNLMDGNYPDLKSNPRA